MFVQYSLYRKKHVILKGSDNDWKVKQIDGYI